ncbi:hypothetical protein [Nostoc sp.]|uniref:hypothetical protein n=1 Tax=Nostoc sp. TaxID=1180 RepID=UPI002FF44FBE
MAKCKHKKGNVCDPPKNDQPRCRTCPYRPYRTLEPTLDYDEEDGLCYLDRTSPDDYEPEPIIAILNF